MVPGPAPPSAADPGDLIAFFAEYLRTAGPRFVVVGGTVGAGKSTFLRGLLAALPRPALLTLYQQPGSPGGDGTSHHVVGAPTRVLIAEIGATEALPAEMPATGAATPPPGIAVPPALMSSLARVQAVRGATAIVDSWDRDSEQHLRAVVQDPEKILEFPLPATEFAALQSTLISLKVNLVLGVTPDLASPLQSIADALLELKEVEHDGGHIRVATVAKIRGGTVETRDHLYSLQGGRFRSFGDLPRGFTPPVTGVEPDPDPSAPSIWPGSTGFADAFGRLKHGGFTALTLAPECPDPLATSVALPVVLHVLRNRGRVIWMAAPSVRPSRIVALLKGELPVDWIRERLRLLSPSGSDPGLGELASVVMPLRREMSGGGDLRSATSPAVGPIFPDAYHFLQRAGENGSCLYVLSVEGLKACAAAASLPLNAVTLPAVLSSYARLPRFHGFGYGPASDPISVALMSSVGTSIHMDLICGRPVVQGQRPRTAPYILNWAGPENRLEFVPCR